MLCQPMGNDQRIVPVPLGNATNLDVQASYGEVFPSAYS